MSEFRETYIEGFEFLSKEEKISGNSEKVGSYKVKKPIISIVILSLIVLGCIFADIIMNHDPVYMDLINTNRAPSNEFFFGTDTMGRDIFSMIWYGGRISLFIGMFSTLISTIIAIVYGGISGLVPEWIDEIMMRFTDILMSIPGILVVIFLQGIIGVRNVWSIAIVIGVTSWIAIAKVVRNEVKQIRSNEYIVAAKSMGAGKIHIIRNHLMPNFISTIMFMIVMNIRSAITLEATLSFFGIGLPVEIISWGSMLSLSEKALLSNSWWIIFIPGLFLVITIACFANIGKYIERVNNVKENNL